MIKTDIAPVKQNDDPQVTHLEDTEPSKKDPEPRRSGEVVDPSHLLLKSRYDELSIPRTAWVFRKSAFYCVMAFSLCMIDSWQVTFRKVTQAEARFPFPAPLLSTRVLLRNLEVETKLGCWLLIQYGSRHGVL